MSTPLKSSLMIGLPALNSSLTGKLLDVDGNKWSLEVIVGSLNDVIQCKLECHGTFNAPKVSILVCCKSPGNLKLRESHGVVVQHPKSDHDRLIYKRESQFTVLKWKASEPFTVNYINLSKSLVPVEFTMTIEQKVNSFNPAHCYSSQSVELVEDITTLMNEDSSFADAKLTVGEQRLHAHKFFLCARSPVFKAMFTSGLSESTSNEIVITDFSVEVERAFLKYLYTDEFDTDEFEPWSLEFVTQILMIAHKYEVVALLVRCERHISAALTVENVLDMLSVASTYEAPNLQKNCISYITFNKAALSADNSYDKLRLLSRECYLELMKSS